MVGKNEARSKLRAIFEDKDVPEHEHRSAFIRGGALVSIGLFLLALFAVLTILVLVLPPSSLMFPLRGNYRKPTSGLSGG